MTKNFVTTVKIAIPAVGTDAQLQTAAQNLASSAYSLKQTLDALCKTVAAERPDASTALRAVIKAAAADQTDKAVYDFNLKKALAAYKLIMDNRNALDKAMYAAVDQAHADLHESNCISPITE